MATEKLLHTLVKIGYRRIEQVLEERQQQRRQLDGLLSQQAAARQATDNAMQTCQAHAEAFQSLLRQPKGFCIEEYLAQERYQKVLQASAAQACRALVDAQSAVDAQERLLDALSMRLAVQERKLQWYEQRLRHAMEQMENHGRDQEDEEAEEICSTRIMSRKHHPPRSQ